MALLIPLRADLDYYEETLTLDGVAFDFQFRWNERDLTWYLSIFDPTVAENADGSRTAILAGIPIRVRWPLLSGYRGRSRPLGDIVAFDTTGQDADPGQRDLGARVVLIYFSQGEVLNFNPLGGLPL